MAANVAMPGYKIYLGSGATGSTVTTYTTSNFTSVADVRDVRFSMNRTPVDVTHFDSPGNAHEYMFGMLDAELTVDINYNPANTTHGTAANALWGDLSQTVPHIWALKYNPGQGVTVTTAQVLVFYAGIASIDQSISVDDRVAASVTFKITGGASWTTG